MCIASLVIGVVSTVLGFIPCANVFVILPAIAGLIMGIVCFRKKRTAGLPSGIALAGIILNSLPLVAMLSFALYVVITGDSHSISELTLL